MTSSPWRERRHTQVPGMPAWSLPGSGYREVPVPASLFREIDQEWAWGGSDGTGVRACLLDSGIDSDHPLVGPVERSWQVVTEADAPVRLLECAPEDVAGHGTACAGIIRQVAPGVRLHSVKVLGNGRSGSALALIAGLSHAIDEGFDVISLSLSTPRPEYRARLAELCDRAYFRRCLLVVAAHNLPVESFPWSFASVISVASHGEADPLRYYYNPAPPVEFFARGVRVPVAVPGGGISHNTGNSFAAPHIVGIAARVLAKHPWLTPFQLKSVLYHCAANVLPRTPGGGVLVTRIAQR
jgi:subtilisin